MVYLKGRDEVAGLLALAGAHAAALQVEEQAVVKEVRSRANRVANCDSANLRRTERGRLAAAGGDRRPGTAAAGWTRCPPALREMADLRSRTPT